MKKIIVLACVIVMIAATFCSCFSLDFPGIEANKTVNPIDFGAKYVNGESYYVFYADNTGVYEIHFEKSNGDVVSARVDFVWREASDGAVYLFEVGEYHYPEHTDGLNTSVSKQPIYFSEDFLTYVSHNSSGANTQHFIKEGSELDKLLNG